MAAPELVPVDQYIDLSRRGGQMCPSCFSSSVRFCGFESEVESTVYRIMECHGCGGSWSDVLNLVGFDYFEVQLTLGM